MIKIENYYDKLIEKPLIEENSIYYYRLIKEETCHKVISDLSAIISNDLFEKAKYFVTPLFQLDLGNLNSKYNQIIPILYHELVMMDWLVFKLNEADKISDLLFIDYEGNRFQTDEIAEDEDELEEHKEVMKEIEETKQGNESNYIQLVKGADFPSNINFRGLESEEYSNFITEKAKEYAQEQKEKTGNFAMPNHFGPFNSLIQYNFSCPKSENGADDFLFVGQVSTSKFHLADLVFYIFYNPKEKIVAQRLQMT